MTTITSDATAADASFLLGWALYEILTPAYPGHVRFPQRDDDWLTAPGHTIFVPVGESTPVARIAHSILPTIQREIERQLTAAQPTDDWFIEYDYWAHAMSGDSESLGQGLRFDVVVHVHVHD
ncbi:hypothetical protein ACIPJ1_11055 [Microbacterium maritypicum]|uniref:hypothetical protein n=1 Tax=Microbacterium maritypicum TaxID=33918 RepID=UPI003815FEEC